MHITVLPQHAEPAWRLTNSSADPIDAPSPSYWPRTADLIPGRTDASDHTHLEYGCVDWFLYDADERDATHATGT